MENSYDYVKENYFKIKENIEKSASKAKINKEEIIFLAATKTVEAEKINYAISLGLNHIGENKVQEMLSKYEDLNLKTCHNHFIGRLQSNKIKYLTDKVECIHSIDSMTQIKELSKQLVKTDKQMKVLVQVNIGDEESKGGVQPEKLLEFIDMARQYKSIKIDGLMCIPPISDKNSEKLAFFGKMYNNYVDIKAKKLDNVSMNILSMGMSDDYQEAIESGSNLIRIGSSLFGKRDYK